MSARGREERIKAATDKLVAAATRYQEADDEKRAAKRDLYAAMAELREAEYDYSE